MDSVRDLGRLSTIRGYFCYDQHNSRAVTEWNYPTVPILNYEDLSFRMTKPLQHIFAIFNDYTKIVYGKQLCHFMRARNDDGATKIANDKTKAFIAHNSIEFKITNKFFNDDIKYNLLQSVKLIT